MMRKIFWEITMFVSLFLSACQSSEQNVSVAQYDGGEVLSLDEKNVDDVRKVKLSELVDDFRIIRFENVDDAFFKSSWMYFSDNYILVRQNNAPLKLFNQVGKFLTNIGDFGQGPGEYKSVYDVLIDEKNECVYMVPLVGNSIYKYNLSGNFLGKIELEEKINKGRIFLQPDNVLSLVQLCFKDLGEKYTGVNVFQEYPDSIQYVYAEQLASNMKNTAGERTGFDNEIWSYRNMDEFAFMMTHADTLYHYDSSSNRIKARFSMKIDSEKLKDNFFILNEFPHHYFIIITGESGRNILVEKENQIAYEANLVNDFMGNMKFHPQFQDGYFYCNLEPGDLKEKIENHLKSGDCPEEQIEALRRLASTLNENDNNILLLGKLRK